MSDAESPVPVRGPVRYTKEFMVSLRGEVKGVAEGFCAPAVVRVDTVKRLGVVRKKEKAEVVGGGDVLGPEERAKLEEIQRLVRQQQPRPVWVPRNPSQEREVSPVPPTPPASVLNPNAKPFVPGSSSSPSPAATPTAPVAEQQNGDGTDDDDWCEDIVLPPPPANGKKIEQNPWRLRQRQKQIRIGLQTVGYKNYVRAKELKFEVETEDPRIPNVYQLCSKRAWDGQVRRWRQLLHKYDELTNVLWNEEEAKEILKIAERQQKFKEKVQKQQLQAELNIIREIATPNSDVLQALGGTGWPTAPTEPISWEGATAGGEVAGES